MSTLPDFTGPGFFAGEAPDGLTTVVSTPQPAEVRVYWRDPDDANAEDVFVASTLSATDGTWRIDNLNPELQYVVRGRKAGFDDVTVVGATPSRTDVIAVEDYLQPTAEFDGLGGYVLIDSGLTPFTASVVDPLPFGLSPVIDGRKLLIEGVSDDEGIWQSTVRVTASNAVTVDVPVQVVIGLKAPVVTARYAVDGDWTITLQLAGASSFAQELRVYRSTAAIDQEDLPAPVAVLYADVVKWVDEDVEPGETYHYLVSAVFDGFQNFSAELLRNAQWSPADLVQAPKIWLDDESGYLSVGGNVSDWINRGSLGGAFTQPVASNRPSIRAAELGAKPVLRFDGVDDNLRMVSADAGNLFRNVSVGWSLIVGRKRGVDGAAARGVFYAPNNTGASRFNIQAGSSALPNTHIVSARRLDTQSTLSVGSGSTGQGWYIRCTHASWGVDTLTDRVNGIETVTALGLGFGSTSNTAGSGQALGLGMASHLATPEGCGDVDLAAVVISSGTTPLTASELRRLEGWAAHRFALTANLPADHPYKLTPP